jgi:hypothetical protein
MFICGDCAGQGRCRSSPSCSSNHDWTVPAVWMVTLSSRKIASLFGNKVWFMGCASLRNLSTYSLAVIQPWKVIMGPREYCTTILLPKPSQNQPHVSLLEPNVGLLGCSANVNSSWCREHREDRLSWPHHARAASFLMFRFYRRRFLWKQGLQGYAGLSPVLQ